MGRTGALPDLVREFYGLATSKVTLWDGETLVKLNDSGEPLRRLPIGLSLETLF